MTKTQTGTDKIYLLFNNVDSRNNRAAYEENSAKFLQESEPNHYTEAHISVWVKNENRLSWLGPFLDKLIS